MSAHWVRTTKVCLTNGCEALVTRHIQQQPRFCKDCRRLWHLNEHSRLPRFDEMHNFPALAHLATFAKPGDHYCRRMHDGFALLNGEVETALESSI